jgi:hypothetical protein
MVTATLTHDQSLRSAYAPGGTIQGYGLVQNEIGAHLKSLLNIRFAVYQREGNTALVGLPKPQFTQDKWAVGHVVTVNQKSVIFAAKQNVPGLVSVVGEVQIDICRIQDSTYRTMDFRVVAEEERLQSHTRKGYLNRHITAK